MAPRYNLIKCIRPSSPSTNRKRDLVSKFYSDLVIVVAIVVVVVVVYAVSRMDGTTIIGGPCSKIGGGGEEEEGSIIDRGSLTPTFCIIAINSRDFKAFHLNLTLESNPLPLREDKTEGG